MDTDVVKLRPLPGRDPIKALRWLLKSAVRQHGLRCVEAYEEGGCNERQHRTAIPSGRRRR
jgi:hypothetical protein